MTKTSKIFSFLLLSCFVQSKLLKEQTQGWENHVPEVLRPILNIQTSDEEIIKHLNEVQKKASLKYFNQDQLSSVLRSLFSGDFLNQSGDKPEDIAEGMKLLGQTLVDNVVQDKENEEKVKNLIQEAINSALTLDRKDMSQQIQAKKHTENFGFILSNKVSKLKTVANKHLVGLYNEGKIEKSTYEQAKNMISDATNQRETESKEIHNQFVSLASVLQNPFETVKIILYLLFSDAESHPDMNESQSDLYSNRIYNVIDSAFNLGELSLEKLFTEEEQTKFIHDMMSLAITLGNDLRTLEATNNNPNLRNLFLRSVQYIFNGVILKNENLLDEVYQIGYKMLRMKVPVYNSPDFVKNLSRLYQNKKLKTYGDALRLVKENEKNQNILETILLTIYLGDKEIIGKNQKFSFLMYFEHFSNVDPFVYKNLELVTTALLDTNFINFSEDEKLFEYAFNAVMSFLNYQELPELDDENVWGLFGKWMYSLSLGQNNDSVYYYILLEINNFLSHKEHTKEIHIGSFKQETKDTLRNLLSQKAFEGLRSVLMTSVNTKDLAVIDYLRKAEPKPDQTKEQKGVEAYNNWVRTFNDAVHAFRKEKTVDEEATAVVEWLSTVGTITHENVTGGIRKKILV